MGDKQKKELTPAEIQKRKKLVIFPIMFLVFAGCMYLIFGTSSDKGDASGMNGFNSEIPMAGDVKIAGNKMSAFEQESTRRREEEKRRSLEDFTNLIEEGDPSDISDREDQQSSRNMYSGSSSQNSIQSSAQAYQNIQKELSSLYQQPTSNLTYEDEQKLLELEWRIQQMEDNKQEQETAQSEFDQQIALLEKSFELNAKYMNGSGQQNNQSDPEPDRQERQEKKNVSSVKPVKDQIVSTLHQMTNEEFIQSFDAPRNYGFVTAIGQDESHSRNTIKGVIRNSQAVMSGQPIKIELVEPMQISNNIIIPKGHEINGIARIQGDRVGIEVSTINHKGNLVKVDLVVYDKDDQEGIYAPTSINQEALRQGISNMNTTAGSNVTFGADAKDQVLIDLARSGVQGLQQFFSKKINAIVVKIPDNYDVVLSSRL